MTEDRERWLNWVKQDLKRYRSLREAAATQATIYQLACEHLSDKIKKAEDDIFANTKRDLKCSIHKELWDEERDWEWTIDSYDAEGEIVGDRDSIDWIDQERLKMVTGYRIIDLPEVLGVVREVDGKYITDEERIGKTYFILRFDGSGKAEVVNEDWVEEEALADSKKSQ